MKTCFIIYGNMASGKTTLCRKVLPLLPGYRYVSMDELRKQAVREHPELSGWAIERKAEEYCLQVLQSGDNILYETTASSQFFFRNYGWLRTRYKTWLIYLYCFEDVCERRFRLRGNTGVVSAAHGKLKPDFDLDTEKYTPDAVATHFTGILKVIYDGYKS